MIMKEEWAGAKEVLEHGATLDVICLDGDDQEAEDNGEKEDNTEDLGSSEDDEASEEADMVTSGKTPLTDLQL